MDCSQCGLKGRVASQNDSEHIRLYSSHRTRYGKTIPWLANIQISNEYVIFFRGNEPQCFRNGGSDAHLESLTCQNRRPDDSQCGFVINEKYSNVLRHGATPDVCTF